MKILAAVALMVSVILIAGTNATLALGMGLMGLAAYIMVNGFVERLERIEYAVEDVRHHAEAERLNAELAGRAGVGSQPIDGENEPPVSA